jgi:hypothetical protein
MSLLYTDRAEYIINVQIILGYFLQGLNNSEDMNFLSIWRWCNDMIYSIIQLFIIYVASQQLQGKLQTQHSTVIGNYILDKHNIKWMINYKKQEEI